MINMLPTVKYAYNYESTKLAIEKLISIKSNDHNLELSAKVLYKSMIDSSFEFLGYEKTFYNYNPQDELAKVALDNLPKEIIE